MARAAIQRRLSWRVASVVDVVDETSRVRSLVLSVPGWPGHRPGEHVDVRLTAEDGYVAERSYSIASAPDDGEHLALTVERIDDGEVSPYLTEELHAGDPLELRGPIGGYFAWTVDDGGPLLLVAGGSGVCPLMAMIRHRAARASTVPTRLLYSSRTLEDVIYRDELARLGADGSGLAVTHTLTRVQPPGWTGPTRRIDAAMLAEVAWPAEKRPLAYVCGPTPLVESVARSLVDLGHDPGRVRTERFGPTGG
ncbi:MAG TPA: ferredoxin reductase [Candidatus Dormibacteraeota bacterium]|nr:ferredoxin reductase [Candidatus Dormibacteraeota bacterium]